MLSKKLSKGICRAFTPVLACVFAWAPVTEAFAAPGCSSKMAKSSEGAEKDLSQCSPQMMLLLRKFQRRH